MGGHGWGDLPRASPLRKPVIEVYDPSKTNPTLDPVFESKALLICYNAAGKLRARIAADWQRRWTDRKLVLTIPKPNFRKRI